MINGVQIENFGPLAQLDWQKLGKINLVIGENGCGKSFLLKALYVAVRALEDYKRGNNPDTLEALLVNKLWWTFQADLEKLHTAVNHKEKADGQLAFNFTVDNKEFTYNLKTFTEISDADETVKIVSSSVEVKKNDVGCLTNNCIFLPAKEVLTIFDVLLVSRERDKRFGFTDTYLDLAKALRQGIPQNNYNVTTRIPPINEENTSVGRESNAFLQCRTDLEKYLGGYVKLDALSNNWYFHPTTGSKIPISLAAEGISKLGVMDVLLGNGYLNEKSMIFIDEPEATLHPTLISKFLDIIAILADHGLQIFIASHSYFVIKKLFLIAQQQKMSIPVLSKEGDYWRQSDLLKDMPINPIIDESIRLYKEEMMLPA